MHSKALRAVLVICAGKSNVPSAVVEKLLEPGMWRREGFWRSALSQYRQAMLKQIVYDVMES